MTKLSAADIRYGRRGGRWVEPSKTGDWDSVVAWCGCDRTMSMKARIGKPCTMCGVEIVAGRKPFNAEHLADLSRERGL